MAAKFIWNMDMTIKIRTSQISRFVIRPVFTGDEFYVDMLIGRKEHQPIKSFKTLEEAQIFVEELSKSI